MSPFIDSMARADEVDFLEAHLSDCEPCQRQLQAFRSLKNLLRSDDEPEVPEDLAFETRVRLSRERMPGKLPWAASRLEGLLSDVIRPFAVPALSGVCLTLLFFGVLLDNIAGYRAVQATEPALARIDRSTPDMSQALMVEIYVDERGKVPRYAVLSGPENNPEVDRWLEDVLSFAEFKPATLFGQPVMSRLIMSFPGASIGVGVS
jgi:hypothetical protein